MVDKRQLRQLLLARRAALPAAVREEFSRRIACHLLALPEYHNADLVMAYADFRGEVPTRDLIARALAEGKRVALPRTDPGRRRLLPVEIGDPDGDLVPGAYGILEPGAGCRPVDARELDLVLVPGVGFTCGGQRLGYGGGYYDRFLARLRPDAVTVGLAYGVQLMDELPAGPHDRKVDMVITEAGTYRGRCNAAGTGAKAVGGRE
jgi:5-formyltetrahydrofolate cyclo-ligase